MRGSAVCLCQTWATTHGLYAFQRSVFSPYRNLLNGLYHSKPRMHPWLRKMFCYTISLLMTGHSTQHLSAHLTACFFFQERNHSILSSGMDKSIGSVHTGKCCILKEPRQHVEAPIDTAEVPLGKEICQSTVYLSPAWDSLEKQHKNSRKIYFPMPCWEILWEGDDSKNSMKRLRTNVCLRGKLSVDTTTAVPALQSGLSAHNSSWLLGCFTRTKHTWNCCTCLEQLEILYKSEWWYTKTKVLSIHLLFCLCGLSVLYRNLWHNCTEVNTYIFPFQVGSITSVIFLLCECQMLLT